MSSIDNLEIATLILKLILGGGIIGVLGYVVRKIIKYGESTTETRFLDAENKAIKMAREESIRVKKEQDDIYGLSDDELDKLF